MSTKTYPLGTKFENGKVYYPKGYCCLCGRKLAPCDVSICSECDMQTG